MASLVRTVESLSHNVASIARTVASLVRTVPEPFLTQFLTTPSGVLARFTQRARSASLMGWDGWMGYQKCPSIFFILFGYIGKVYTYLYMQ